MDSDDGQRRTDAERQKETKKDENSYLQLTSMFSYH